MSPHFTVSAHSVTVTSVTQRVLQALPGPPRGGRRGRSRRHLLAGLAIALVAAAAGAQGTKAPVLSGLGPYRGPTATANPAAQRYFGQGVVLTWGFNPAEAARAFETAAALDPACALCWWGVAWSLGPNVNSDMRDEDGPRVAAALAKAKAVARTPRERAWIDALAARHPDPTRPGHLDEAAYAARMQALARRYPGDPDVATLAAEALVNLSPYDWWEADGRPKPGTTEILAHLDRAIAKEPRHAGALHYRIHVLESSPHPEGGLSSAKALAGLVPGSGHLLHMPAHIDMRTGRYDDAVKANLASIAADERYVAEVDAQRAYRVGYVAHNHHFLYASAAMDGRSGLALQAARDAWPSACGPGGADRSTGILQHYYVLPLFALVRFGRWDAILADTLPPDVAEPYPLAIWHYARGTAYARTGRLDEARRELAKVEALAADPRIAGVRIKNINPAQAMTRIAALTLAADIAQASGRPADAVAKLAEATAVDDGLRYDEPHLWLAPTRHALGAALLAAGRPADAERVYREDLAHYPDNAWSLAGLALALEGQGKAAQAAAVRARLAQATARADVRIATSRF